MSENDPELDLPEYLVEAVLSAGPPASAIDVLKEAFVWRTIEADLLEISFDSALEPTAVRDADAVRTLELSAGSFSVVVEIGADDRLRGQLVPAAEGSVELRGLERTISSSIAADGRFIFDEVLAGPVRLRVVVTASFESPTFVI